jgi:RNA polymerase sigma factor (sigma-70 family)
MGRKKVEKLWESDFQFHSSFEDSHVGTELLSFDINHLQPGVHTDIKMTAPPESVGYLSELYAFPLLTREGERVLFLRLNYTKYLANKIRESHPQVTMSDYKGKLKDQYDSLLKIAYDTRNVIANHNLRLVVSLAKKIRVPGLDLYGIISNGNMSLLHAIDKFDIGRMNAAGTNNKFSTYASWAIKKNFWRDNAPAKNVVHIIDTPVYELPIMDHRIVEEDSDLKDEAETLRRVMRKKLTRREFKILSKRFGMEGDEHTLEEVGNELKVTKERVRQIQIKATQKLRAAYATMGDKAACKRESRSKVNGKTAPQPPVARGI